MIAIDSNVLLRHLLEDSRAQAKKAHHLMLGDQAVLITDVVLAETIWTLKGKKIPGGERRHFGGHQRPFGRAQYRI